MIMIFPDKGICLDLEVKKARFVKLVSSVSEIDTDVDLGGELEFVGSGVARGQETQGEGSGPCG